MLVIIEKKCSSNVYFINFYILSHFQNIATRFELFIDI